MIHLYPGRAWRRTALFSFDPFEKGRSFDKTPEYPSSLFHSGEKTGPPPGLPARTAANLPNRRKEAMMSDVSQTPTGLVIEKRNWKFGRSEEHTSELQSLMRISYAVFCLKKKKKKPNK